MKTTERTIDRPRVERPHTADAKGRSLTGLLAAVAALIVGLLVGYLLWGGDGGDPTALATGGDELTPRQEQMLDVVEDYEAAWQRGDRAGAAAMFTEDGILTVFGTEYEGDRIATGIGSVPTLDVHDPRLFEDNWMLSFHDVVGFDTLFDVMEFTEEGEVLIVSHEIGR